MEKEKENICPICFSTLEDDVNFCQDCGEAISDLAKELEKDRKTNTEIEILTKIMDYLSSEKDLKFVKGLIEKLADGE